MSASAVYVLDLKGKVRPRRRRRRSLRGRSGGAGLAEGVGPRDGGGSPGLVGVCGSRFPLPGASLPAAPVLHGAVRRGVVARVSSSQLQVSREVLAGPLGIPPGVINPCRNWGWFVSEGLHGLLS